MVKLDLRIVIIQIHLRKVKSHILEKDRVKSHDLEKNRVKYYNLEKDRVKSHDVGDRVKSNGNKSNF